MVTINLVLVEVTKVITMMEARILRYLAVIRITIEVVALEVAIAVVPTAEVPAVVEMLKEALSL